MPDSLSDGSGVTVSLQTRPRDILRFCLQTALLLRVLCLNSTDQHDLNTIHH